MMAQLLLLGASLPLWRPDLSVVSVRLDPTDHIALTIANRGLDRAAIFAWRENFSLTFYSANGEVLFDDFVKERSKGCGPWPSPEYWIEVPPRGRQRFRLPFYGGARQEAIRTARRVKIDYKYSPTLIDVEWSDSGQPLGFRDLAWTPNKKSAAFLEGSWTLAIGPTSFVSLPQKSGNAPCGK